MQNVKMKKGDLYKVVKSGCRLESSHGRMISPSATVHEFKSVKLKKGSLIVYLGNTWFSDGDFNGHIDPDYSCIKKYKQPKKRMTADGKGIIV